MAAPTPRQGKATKQSSQARPGPSQAPQSQSRGVDPFRNPASADPRDRPYFWRRKSSPQGPGDDPAEQRDQPSPPGTGAQAPELDPDFDPISAARHSSVLLDDVLAFRWAESDDHYLSDHLERAFRAAAVVNASPAIVTDPPGCIRPSGLLQSLLAVISLADSASFGRVIGASARARQLFDILLPSEQQALYKPLMTGTPTPPPGAPIHWESVEILAHASELRRVTNKKLRDIGQRHLLFAMFATREGQTAFRDLGGLAKGFDELKAAIVDCCDVGQFTKYHDDRAAWHQFRESLKGTPQLVHRIERRPDYLNDRVRLTKPDDLAQESLGAAEDARALADLILLEAATPPIAVGLFGPWGSGKSTLIEHLKAEIREQTREERGLRLENAANDDRTRIVSNVVQLSFNAWTFADSANLWATFTSEIFDQLAAGGVGFGDDDPGAAQEDLKTRAAAASLVSEVAARTAREVASLQTADVAVKEQDLAIEAAEALLRKVRADRHVAFGAGIADAAREMRQPAAGDAAVPESLVQLAATGLALGWKRALPIALLILVVGALLYRLPDLPIPAGWTAIASSSAAIIAALWPALRAVGSAYRHWQQRKVTARQAIAEADADLRQRRQARARAERERVRSEAFLASYTKDGPDMVAGSPMRMLDYLLKESESVAAVRAQTGLLATVRRCFEQLETVIRKARGQPGAVDRVILYIDDLDRCGTRQVSDILQALHLLLSFDCFVVVVAADANWLKHSLEDQHPQLFDDKSGRLTPADYLEKIFQIPFWVRPLVDADAKEETRFRLYQTYVDDLLREDARRDQKQEGKGTAPPDRPEPPETGAVASFKRASPTRKEEPAAPRRERIILSDDERNFLKELGPLAAKSPRAVKRMINIYRLMRVRLEGQRLDAFLKEGSEEVASYRAVLFALACEVGLPPATMTDVADALSSMEDPEWNDLPAAISNHRTKSPKSARGATAKTRATSTLSLIEALQHAGRLDDFQLALTGSAASLDRRQVQMGLEEVRRYSFRPL